MAGTVTTFKYFEQSPFRFCQIEFITEILFFQANDEEKNQNTQESMT